jgi:hypothetical protein
VSNRLGRKSILPENSIFSGRELSRGERVAVAIPIAVAAALAAWLAFQRVPEMMARDFTYPWWGARALLSGENPYDTIRPTGPPPNDLWFMYPLTAPIAVIPFARLPAQLAGALFSGLSAGLLAFVLSANGGLRSFLVFLSPSFGFAIVLGQWSPLLVAASFAVPLSWALVCKPTIGLPLFLYRPSWRAAIICSAFLLLSILIQPSWPLDWWRNTQRLEGHFLPVLRPFGFLGVLAFLRWRRPEGRLVGGMTLVPQNLYFYDQLPLFLAATTVRRTLLLILLSWSAWWLGRIGCETPRYCGPESEIWIIVLMYIPAACMALFSAADVQRLLDRIRTRSLGT